MKKKQIVELMKSMDITLPSDVVDVIETQTKDVNSPAEVRKWIMYHNKLAQKNNRGGGSNSNNSTEETPKDVLRGIVLAKTPFLVNGKVYNREDLYILLTEDCRYSGGKGRDDIECPAGVLARGTVVKIGAWFRRGQTVSSMYVDIIGKDVVFYGQMKYYRGEPQYSAWNYSFPENPIAYEDYKLLLDNIVNDDIPAILSGDYKYKPVALRALIVGTDVGTYWDNGMQRDLPFPGIMFRMIAQDRDDMFLNLTWFGEMETEQGYKVGEDVPHFDPLLLEAMNEGVEKLTIGEKATVWVETIIDKTRGIAIFVPNSIKNYSDGYTIYGDFVAFRSDLTSNVDQVQTVNPFVPETQDDNVTDADNVPMHEILGGDKDELKSSHEEKIKQLKEDINSVRIQFGGGFDPEQLVQILKANYEVPASIPDDVLVQMFSNSS